ncbi:hypothetical protein SKAU_G00335620 [Synaphobranchus kaupii]|uniref:Uncharacterized protein n=1 Tax=Synaphobranchus kaupii TaxID=118154 RepID=A0A9Q1EM31_SYNKA|nr:hypothetical protein SKAU_G00335620 [Synaphobranchus kaupii]
MRMQCRRRHPQRHGNGRGGSRYKAEALTGCSPEAETAWAGWISKRTPTAARLMSAVTTGLNHPPAGRKRPLRTKAAPPGLRCRANG